MIHVATVHWRSDRWVDIQLRYLDRFLEGPHRVYAFLHGRAARHRDRFFHASTEPIRDHATKLNLLGDVIRFAADDPSDLLVFVDGDAFPIAPIEPFVRERLADHELIAVRRLENNGDLQPHPCFCVTTVGFWAQIDGDWHRGHRWRNNQGEPVTDVGGNLLGRLQEAGIDWYPLDRSNRRDLHPLFFGVYGDLVYHHGAGFRVAKSLGGRITRVAEREAELRRRPMARLLDLLPRGQRTRELKKRLHPVRKMKDRVRAELTELDQRMFERIEADEDFYRELIGGISPRA